MATDATPTDDISPLDPEKTKRALADVDNRDRVVMHLLRALRSRMPFACFLAVRHDVAVGRVALVGDRVDRERIGKVRIPLTSPLFQRVTGAGATYAGPLTAGEWGVEMLRYLEGKVPRTALLLPMWVAGRMAGIAIGHFEATPSGYDLQPLLDVADAAGRALERLIVKAKESVGTAPSAGSGPVRAEADADAVLAAVQQAIAARPEDLDARRKLVRLYRGLEAWAPLSDALTQLVEVGRATGQIGEDEQIELRVQVAELERDVLGRVPQAMEAWRRVLELDPGDLRAMTALETLLSAESRWPETLDLLEKRAVLVDGTDERIAVLMRIAELQIYNLGSPALAVPALTRALALDPNHVAAAELLEGIYRKARRWPDLCDLLLEKARHAAGDSERHDLLVAVARLYEDEVADAQAAYLVWQTVVRQDPTDAAARDELERLAARLGQWDNHLPFLEELAGSLEKSRRDTAAALWTTVARGTWEELGHVDRALEAADHALRLAPEHREALALRGVLLRRQQNWRELAEVLQRQAAAETEPDTQVATFMSLGQLQENELGDPAQARAAYERALALDPEHPDVTAALVRLYRTQERWDDLIRLLERLVAAGTPPAGDETLADLELELGRLLQQHSASPERAIGVLEAVLARDPGNHDARTRLAAAYEEQAGRLRAAKDFRALVAVHEREIEIASDAAVRIELQVDLGELYERQLGEPDRALDAYLAAIALSGQDARALAGAARIHEQAGRWRSAAEVLEKLVAIHGDRGGDVDATLALARAWTKLSHKPRADFLRLADAIALAASTTSDGARRSFLLGEEARLRAEQLDDAAGAEERLARAVALDPENLTATATLAAIYFDRADWEKCAPLAAALASHGGGAAEHERAAICARELGDLAAADRYFQRAVELEPARLSALVGRADVLHRLERWEAGAKLDQQLLLTHRERLGRAELLDAYRRQGVASLQLGQSKKALTMFDHALEVDPKDIESLERLAELHRTRGEPGAAAAMKRRLLAAWQDALAANPQNHRLLQKMLDAQTEAGDWKDAVQTIERFLQIERDHVRRGLYHHAAAAIHREQLKNVDEAIAEYDLALDELFAGELAAAMRPRALEAFRGIDELLTAKKDWANQQRAYRRMIKRLPAGDPLLVSLWDTLGEVCRSRLKQPDQAIEAFEVAQHLDPDNATRKQILAELYTAAGGGRIEQAAAHLGELMRASPRDPDAYHRLFRVYVDARELDRAWCVARALVFLGAATPDEARFHQQHEPSDFPATRAVMTDDVFRHVVHPDANRFISAVFSVMWRVPALASARRHAELGLDRKQTLDVAGDRSLLAQMLVYVARTLNLAMPDLFVDAGKRGVMSLANAHVRNELTPGLVVRKDFLEVSSRRQVAFVLARMLTRMRPEYYLKLALPTTAELKTAFLSAVVLARPGLPVPPELAEAIGALVPKLRAGLTPRRLEELITVVGLFIDSGTAVDLSRWAHAVETTAHRAGLVLCGDLKTAAALVTQERTVLGGPGPEDKVNELLLYSVSEGYFSARRLLGLQVR